jgi:hypothetical protein
MTCPATCPRCYTSCRRLQAYHEGNPAAPHTCSGPAQHTWK